jgi:xylan 1,4-beta-xylosidase
VVPAAESAPLAVQFRHARAGKYRLQVRRTGFKANDAYTAYIEMGAPKELTPAQVEQLHALTKDAPESDRTVTVGKNGSLDVAVPMRANDVVLVTLEPLAKP